MPFSSDNSRKRMFANRKILANANPTKVREFDEALTQAEKLRTEQDEMERTMPQGIKLRKHYGKTDLANAKMYNLARELGLH
jgi:hypothetical protein